MWRADDPQGGESQKIVWEIVPYTRGRGLDVGCGPSKAFPHFIGVDNYKDTALFGIQMKPDVAIDDCTRMHMFANGSMDFVYSSHTLEHVKDFDLALREWWRLIKPNGHLILYLPHKLFYPNIGQPGANPDHVHDFMPEDIVKAMKEIGAWDLVRNEDRNENTEYSFFQVYKKRTDFRSPADRHLYSYKNPRPEKRAAVLRYGAFGDLLQASSLFPGLKEQGYHITVYTTPRGAEVVRHDPHIDEFYIQDTDQVPNNLLADFWDWEAKKFDKFINLSESVEGQWLALPGRMNRRWPSNLRRKYMNGNYLEFAHDLADVPMPPRQKFHATQDEKSWAKKERERIGGDFMIVYALSGSSVHKCWPHQDGLFARLLTTYPNCRIVTMGDEMAKMLEHGWENEPRVVCKSGEYSIRESLSLLDRADMVIGPETGVVNAAGFMDMPKVVFLSHSSRENLTRDWVNTITLEPENTPCYPCHMMHYSFENCNQDAATGTAACQADISLDQAWKAVSALIEERGTKCHPPEVLPTR